MLESSPERFQEPLLEQSLLISSARCPAHWRRRSAKGRVRHAAGYRYSGLENSLGGAKTRSEETCRSPTRVGASLLAQRSAQRAQPRKLFRSRRVTDSQHLRRLWW